MSGEPSHMTLTNRREHLAVAHVWYGGSVIIKLARNTVLLVTFRSSLFKNAGVHYH
jgi:hypothetical protein